MPPAIRLIAPCLLALFGAVAGACGDDSTPRAAAPPDAGVEGGAGCKALELAIDGRCIAPGWSACSEGFTVPESGVGCREIAANDCSSGTMPKLGSDGCAPVGVPSCSAGSKRDATGFGCVPNETPTCSGATRESGAGCVPIGDCAAAFPPAAATIFVDDSFTNGQLDAAHFRSIAAAVQAAPAGATIAVEAGTYAEAVTITKTVSVIGRCAEQVVLSGGAGAVAGVTVASAVNDVAISGIRVSGFEPGIAVSGGGALRLADAVVFANRSRGLRVSGAGSRLTIARSAIRGTLPDAVAQLGLGASAEAGAALTIEDSAVADNREASVSVTGAGSTAHVARTMIARTAPRADGLMAIGASADAGARIEIDSSVIVKSAGAAVSLDDATAKINASALVDVGVGRKLPGSTPVATGVLAAKGADLTLEKSTVSGTDRAAVQLDASKGALRDVALAPADGGVDAVDATVELTRTAIIEASGFGIGARDASNIDVDDVLVTKTRPKSGVAYAVIAAEGSAIKGRGLVTTETVGTALLAFDRGVVTLDRTIVDRTQIAGGTLGVGVLSEKKSTITLRSSVVRRATAIGVAVKGAKLELEDVVIRDTQEINDGLSGFGILATEAAAVTVKRVSLTDTAIAAVMAGGPGTTVTGSDLTAARTRPGKTAAGRGLQAQDGARLDLERAFLVENRGVSGMAFEGTLVLRDSLVQFTAEADPPFGHGLVAKSGRLDVHRVSLVGNAGAGLIYVGSTGLVVRSNIERNGVGLNATGGTKIVSVEGEPSEPSDNEVLVSSDTAFIGNATRIGSGELPVPPPVELQ